MRERATLKAPPAMQAVLATRRVPVSVAAPTAPAPPPEAQPTETRPAPAPEAQDAAPPPGVSKSTARARSKRRRNLDRNNRITLLMRERFPGAFEKRRPLAVGIHLQIIDAIGKAEMAELKLNRTYISHFLGAWCNLRDYRAALDRGERRINLDGSDAGPAFMDREETEGVSPAAADKAPEPAIAPPSVESDDNAL